jgi:cell wall-associated NlpC family hydrolase
MDFSRLGIGDLVFFDAKGGPQIDHVGMYLGRDADRRHRFVSSRKKHNGPTWGDYKGASLLDGTGFFAKAFCAVRRI